jgi:hypothetical protein
LNALLVGRRAGVVRRKPLSRKRNEIVAEIQANAAERAEVTVESLIREAEEVRRLAVECKQYSAAVSAIKEIGILSGKRIERREQGGPGEFDHLSDEELRAELMRLVTELGLVAPHTAMDGGKAH